MTKKATLSWFLSSKIASLFKISAIIGAHTAFFSLINVVNPLIGAFNTKRRTFLLFALLFLSKLIVYKTVDLHFLAYIIPGMCAAFYWNVQGPFLRLYLPALCLMAFLVHPTGLAAAPYTCYWLIPLILYFKKHNSLFLHALSSTLIAHAVGSVIWLYSVPMNATIWLGLIPIVFLERITFATAIAATHLCLSQLLQRQVNSLNENKQAAYIA